MTAVLWLLGGLAVLTVALVAVHMTRPYARRGLLSAARFFWPAAPPSASRRRWRWANPLRSRPLWLQFPAALLLVLALLLYQQTVAATPQAQALGVWLLLDTSASMSVQEGAVTRFALAQVALARVVAAAAQVAQGHTLCFRLSTFDQEVRHWLTDADAAAVLGSAGALQPRGLGTDLALVEPLAAQAIREQSGCRITHLIVISDQPAPQTTAQVTTAQVTAAQVTAAPLGAQAVLTPSAPLLWESVELKTANSAITAIEATVDPLSRQVISVALHVTAYGDIGSMQLEIIPPDALAFTAAPAWQMAGPQERRWVYRLAQPAAGRYLFRLVADDGPARDGLAYDNQAAIAVPQQVGIEVDWRLSSTAVPERLGWRLAATAPVLRVVAAAALDTLPADRTPLLLVGEGYGPPFTPAPIVDFAGGSALLDNVSFEQLERTGLAPFTTLAALPPAFVPLLADGSDAQANVWLAERQQPPAVYIPGLPAAPDLADETWRSSALLFANAVRWLLKEQGAPPLYTVTNPNAPEPSGTHIVLHPAESNTLIGGGAAADLSRLAPGPATVEETPIWPWLVVAAIALLITERNLAAWRGGPWC